MLAGASSFPGVTMPLRLLAPAGQTVDLTPMTAELEALAAHLLAVETKADAGLDGVDNTKTMIRNRDQRIAEAQTVADAAAAKADSIDVKRGEYETALRSSVEDRAALHAQVGTLAQRFDTITLTPGPAGKDGKNGTDGKAGAAGTANLAIGARPVGLLALGGSTTITVPLSRAMPDTSYRVEVAHSAVVTLAAGMLEVTGKTTTAVTVKVTAVGIALAAGTVVVVAV